MHKMLCIFHAQACIWTKKYNHLHISWLQMVVFKLVLRGLTQSVCPVTIFNNMHLQFFYQIINLKSNCLHRVNAFTLTASTYILHTALTNGMIWLLLDYLQKDLFQLMRLNLNFQNTNAANRESRLNILQS